MYKSENEESTSFVLNVPKSAMMAHCDFKVTKLYHKKTVTNRKLKCKQIGFY